MNYGTNKSATLTSECSSCGTAGAGRFSSATSGNRWSLLHNVRLRGIYRRLCTSCVLRLHPGSFCPTCFDLFDNASPPPHHFRVSCQKCPSISHPGCVSNCNNNGNIHLDRPYTCPPCSNPNFNFLELRKVKEEGSRGEERREDEKFDKDRWILDEKAARVLLCAARIAAISMGKAVVVARAEAERRVREASMSRKRAREALDRVAVLAMREKARKEGSVDGSVYVGSKDRVNNGGLKVGGMKRSGVENLGGQVSKDSNAGVKDRERREGIRAQNEVVELEKNVVDEGERREKCNGARDILPVQTSRDQLQNLENSSGKKEDDSF